MCPRERIKLTKMKANVKSPKTPVVAKSSNIYEEENAKVKFQKGKVLNVGDTKRVKSFENVPYPEPTRRDWASLDESWLIAAKAT